MSFGDEEEESKHGENVSSSASGRGSLLSSRSSSIVNMSALQLVPEDEDEEFQDAVEIPACKLLLSDADYLKKLSKTIVLDCDEERIALPCMRDTRLQGNVFWQILKDLIGKDISKYSMPVAVNEPLSHLQKYSEIFQFNDLLHRASQEENSLRRLLLVATYNAAIYFLIHERLQKPFNPLLGETFELVTPEYQAVSEQVSHHPPMTAMFCEGEGYTIHKLTNATVRFTGKSINMTDPNKYFITLTLRSGEKELYTLECPNVVVGNLVIGEQYTEPHGASVVTN